MYNMKLPHKVLQKKGDGKHPLTPCSPAELIISIAANNLSFNVLDNMQEGISVRGEWG